MSVRGIRGATIVDVNEEQTILNATVELLNGIISENEIIPDDICSVFVTVTNDLDESFPARAIRQIKGWELVPLMCALEVPVKGSLERCVRLMILINTDKTQAQIRHVYLNGAQVLRPDLAN